MTLFGSWKPDIETMRNLQDVHGLIRLMNHRNADIQWRAADALGTMGEDAIDPLINALLDRHISVRLGAIEALGTIRAANSVDPLIATLNHDAEMEVKTAAALALGEVGDTRAIEPLVLALREPARYLRYAAARALDKLLWLPRDDTDRAYYAIALQDWQGVKKLGKAAIDPLISMAQDPDTATRVHCVEIMGMIGNQTASRACEIILRDPDPGVRWNAILAAKKCGVPITHLPWGLSKRPRTGRNPWGAAILNFFFIGLGYNYLGFWWGFLVFMSYMSIMVIVQLSSGPFIPYLIAYPITALFAVQTFYMARRMPDM